MWDGTQRCAGRPRVPVSHVTDWATRRSVGGASRWIGGPRRAARKKGGEGGGRLLDTPHTFSSARVFLSHHAPCIMMDGCGCYKGTERKQGTSATRDRSRLNTFPRCESPDKVFGPTTYSCPPGTSDGRGSLPVTRKWFARCNVASPTCNASLAGRIDGPSPHVYDWSGHLLQAHSLRPSSSCLPLRDTPIRMSSPISEHQRHHVIIATKLTIEPKTLTSSRPRTDTPYLLLSFPISPNSTLDLSQRPAAPGSFRTCSNRRSAWKGPRTCDHAI